MSKNITTKVKGENVKEITFEVKDLNLDERLEFNKVLQGKNTPDDYSSSDYVKMIRIASNLTDDQINELTDVDWVWLGWECYRVVNKKKQKK